MDWKIEIDIHVRDTTGIKGTIDPNYLSKTKATIFKSTSYPGQVSFSCGNSSEIIEVTRKIYFLFHQVS